MSKIFTRSQLQTLKTVLTEMIVDAKRLQNEYKTMAIRLRTHCNKDDVSTFGFFLSHSDARTRFKKFKQRSSNLESVQKKIKRALGSCNSGAAAEFTQRELHIIKSIIKNQILELDFNARVFREYASTLWSFSEKNQPETLQYFVEMNSVRDRLRYIKADKQRLAKIQHALKRELYRGSVL